MHAKGSGAHGSFTVMHDRGRAGTGSVGNDAQCDDLMGDTGPFFPL
jgi:hypothetical protein